MKRGNGTINGASSNKRPFARSCVETNGQPPHLEESTVENGVCNSSGGSGSSSSSDEGSGRYVTTSDALNYLKAVKDTFRNEREKYDQFLDLMQDFKAQRVDSAYIVETVKELFKGHNELLLGFNTFLPVGYKITTGDELNYLKEVKDTFRNEREKYDQFLDLMQDFKAGRVGHAYIGETVKELFKGHNELILGFNTFLPERYKIMIGDEDESPRSSP